LGTAVAAVALMPPAVAAYFLAAPAISAWLPKYAAVAPQIGSAAPLMVFGSLRIASTAYASLKLWRTLAWTNTGYFAAASVIPFLWLACDREDSLRATVASLYAINILHAVLSVTPLLRIAHLQAPWLR